MDNASRNDMKKIQSVRLGVSSSFYGTNKAISSQSFCLKLHSLFLENWSNVAPKTFPKDTSLPHDFHKSQSTKRDRHRSSIKCSL